MTGYFTNAQTHFSCSDVCNFLLCFYCDGVKVLLKSAFPHIRIEIYLTAGDYGN